MNKIESIFQNPEMKIKWNEMIQLLNASTLPKKSEYLTVLISRRNFPHSFNETDEYWKSIKLLLFQEINDWPTCLILYGMVTTQIASYLNYDGLWFFRIFSLIFTSPQNLN